MVLLFHLTADGTALIWRLEHTGTSQKATSHVVPLDEDTCKAELS